MLSHRLMPAVATVLVVAACAAPTGDGTPAPTALTSVAEPPRCAPPGGPNDPAHALDGWSLSAPADPAFVPLIASSLVTVGPNRFLYGALDAEQRPLASADRRSRVSIYALERDPATPVATVDAVYLESSPGRGLYRALLEFDCVGEWGAEIALAAADDADGPELHERVRFSVQGLGSVPGIGQPAPRSETLTADTPAELAGISTDPQPYAQAHDTTVAEAVTSGQPALVFFATPAFCQSGACGPTVELVKRVAREHEDAVDLVIVEPYELHETEHGLQPALDEEGRLQPVAAALEYGILVEPYLFVVDAAGDVFARFEVVVGEDELRAALADVLAAAA
jgi:hypothetical protein